MTGLDSTLETTPVFWGTPGAQDITDYVWDTRVPQVTEPWPTLGPLDLRDAFSMVLGTPDVTGKLYQIDEFRTMLNLPQLARCPHCGSTQCQDKWCGLRGDTTVLAVIEGEFRG